MTIIKFLIVPRIPTGFNYTRVYHRSLSSILTFEWDPPGGSGPEAVVDNYTISISSTPLSHPSIFAVFTNPLNVTLAYNVTYVFNITATNCVGDSGTFQLNPITISKKTILAKVHP